MAGALGLLEPYLEIMEAATAAIDAIIGPIEDDILETFGLDTLLDQFSAAVAAFVPDAGVLDGLTDNQDNPNAFLTDHNDADDFGLQAISTRSRTSSRGSTASAARCLS